MLEVTVEQLLRDFSRYLDVATEQPIAVMVDGERSVVLLSMDEYTRLRARDREALRAEELPDEKIAASAAA